MKKVLIMEDELNIRSFVVINLKRAGYDAIEAGNGQEALDILAREDIHLVLLDVMMPEMDGYELVRALRESGSRIPVLMITAKDRFQDMQLGT